MNKFKFRSKKIAKFVNGMFNVIEIAKYKIKKHLGRSDSIQSWLRSESRDVSDFNVIAIFALPDGLSIHVGTYFDGIENKGFFCQSDGETLTHKKKLIPYKISMSAIKLINYSNSCNFDVVDFIVQTSELHRGFK